MDEEQQMSEWATRFVNENPEFVGQVFQRYVELCAERGIEPDPAVFAQYLFAAFAVAAENAQAVVDEFFPPKQVERLFDEEFERLYDPDTKAVRVEDLDEAVGARMRKRMEHHFPQIQFPEEE